MAIELHIFVSSTLVPTSGVWQDAIDQVGFPIALDTSLDVQAHTGFWPASYKGKQTGFEFYLTPAAELLTTYPHVAEQVGDREECATFRWGGNLLEMCAALSAAAALTKLADGVYFHPDDDIIYNSDEAVRSTQRNLRSVST